MTRKTPRQPKAPRAKEYTGPNTLEDVKKFWESNATQKAKTQAAEALSPEDQVELMKWAQKRLLDAVNVLQKNMEIERKRRGFGG